MFLTTVVTDNNGYSRNLLSPFADKDEVSTNRWRYTQS